MDGKNQRLGFKSESPANMHSHTSLSEYLWPILLHLCSVHTSRQIWISAEFQLINLFHNRWLYQRISDQLPCQKCGLWWLCINCLEISNRTCFLWLYAERCLLEKSIYLFLSKYFLAVFRCLSFTEGPRWNFCALAPGQTKLQRAAYWDTCIPLSVGAIYIELGAIHNAPLSLPILRLAFSRVCCL